MKKSKFIRRLDPLGRIVLPKSFRDSLDISIKDDIEIFSEGTSIVVSKHEPHCVFCGETENISSIGGQNVCNGCHDELLDMK